MFCIFLFLPLLKKAVIVTKSVSVTYTGRLMFSKGNRHRGHNWRIAMAVLLYVTCNSVVGFYLRGKITLKL